MEDFFKFCGLLRISELYLTGASQTFDWLTTCFHGLFWQNFLCCLLRSIQMFVFFCKIISYIGRFMLFWSKDKRWLEKIGEIRDLYWLLDVLSEILVCLLLLTLRFIFAAFPWFRYTKLSQGARLYKHPHAWILV